MGLLLKWGLIWGEVEFKISDIHTLLEMDIWEDVFLMEAASNVLQTQHTFWIWYLRRKVQLQVPQRADTVQNSVVLDHL